MKYPTIKYAFALLVALTLCSAQIQAQDISNTRLRWTIAGMQDLESNANVSGYTCTFETNGSSAAYWRQKDGSFSTKFTVKSIVGVWANVASEGSATFNIVADGQDGTLLFEKNSTGIFVTLDLSQPDGSRNAYKFTVTQTTPF